MTNKNIETALALYNEKMTDESLRDADANFEQYLPEDKGATNWREAVNHGIPQCCEVHFIGAGQEIMEVLILTRSLCMASGCDDHNTHNFLQYLVDCVNAMLSKVLVDTVSGN